MWSHRGCVEQLVAAKNNARNVKRIVDPDKQHQQQHDPRLRRLLWHDA